jgi:hypothetical protein
MTEKVILNYKKYKCNLQWNHLDKRVLFRHLLPERVMWACILMIQYCCYAKTLGIAILSKVMSGKSASVIYSMQTFHKVILRPGNNMLTRSVNSSYKS